MNAAAALCHACLDEFSADGPCPGCASRKALAESSLKVARLERLIGDVVNDLRFFPQTLAQLRALMPGHITRIEAVADGKETNTHG